MKASSVNALLGLSIIFLIPGLAIISPDGRLICLIGAAITAGIALGKGKTKGKRILAGLILLLACGFAIPTFSEYRIQYDRYRDRHRRVLINGEMPGCSHPSSSLYALSRIPGSCKATKMTFLPDLPLDEKVSQSWSKT